MDWMREHRLALIGTSIVTGFFIYALSQPATPAPATNAVAQDFKKIDQASHMTRGSSSAKVSLIQYSDFLCPSCSYVSTQIMPQIDKDYIEQGRVQFEFRPMAFIADGSVQAGMGAYCAIDQNKFWPYHDAIYAYVANQIFRGGKDPTRDTILTADLVKSIASTAGISPNEFNNCLDSRKYYSEITNSTKTANRNGINSTPYVMVNGKPVTGNPSLPVIEAMIKSSL